MGQRLWKDESIGDVMNQGLRIGVLTAIITTALVYVVLEWRPLRPEPTQSEVVDTTTPDVAVAAPGTVAASTTPLQTTALSPNESNNIEVYRKYSPGVVNITSTILTYDFFLRPIPESGSGSGIIADTDGNIVTNYHVIEGARQLEVTLWDQSRYEARVVGSDPNNDIAVIHIDAAGQDLVPIPMGSTEGLQVGQKVLAIGNPFGLQGTLTTGIISSLGRSIQGTNGRVIEGVVQTDAAINPGNSGGPLLNSRGEVIGINTAIVSPSNTGNVGIGFAVPVETVRRVTNDLITYGRVRRVFMGFSGLDLDRLGGLVEALNLGTESGVLIVGIQPNSPADNDGLMGPERDVRIGNYRIPVGGDVIVGIDGRNVSTVTEVSAILEQHRPGDQITVTVVRDRQPLDVRLTLTEETP